MLSNCLLSVLVYTQKCNMSLIKESYMQKEFDQIWQQRPKITYKNLYFD